MSMIENQIKRLENLKTFIAENSDDNLTIKELRSHLQIIDDASFTIKRLSAKLAEENMKQNSAHYDGDWIPCDVRLPQEKENPITRDYYEYQVTFESDGVRDVRHYTFGGGHWWNGPGIVDEFVTAWMERPEPYKKEV